MVAYLSEAWLDQAVDPVAEALAVNGASVTIGRIVSGAPDGEARFTARVGDGSVTYERGVDDTVDISLTDTFANAKAQLLGELDPNSLFMRGQTKVTGPTSKILEVIAATKSDRYQEARVALLASVDV